MAIFDSLPDDWLGSSTTPVPGLPLGPNPGAMAGGGGTARGIFANRAGYTDYAPALTALGGFTSAGASLMQGAANARLANANAGVAGLEARSAVETGAEAAELYRQHLNQRLGSQRASIGGANVTMGGSSLRALSSTASLGAQDIARVQLNASRKAWGFEVQQAGDLYRAQQARMAGTMGALGALSSAGSRAYGQWNSGFAGG